MYCAYESGADRVIYTKGHKCFTKLLLEAALGGGGGGGADEEQRAPIATDPWPTASPCPEPGLKPAPLGLMGGWVTIMLC